MAVKTTLKRKTPVASVTETKTTPLTARNDTSKLAVTKKVCLFCESKKEPTYTDVTTLRKFMSERARIVARARSGACSKHQRRIAREIKYARHLSMMPFVNKV